MLNYFNKVLYLTVKIGLCQRTAFLFPASKQHSSGVKTLSCKLDDRESPEDDLITRLQHAARITEINLILLYSTLPIPVAARSKSRVCGS
jgi:hypothetical protein